MEKVYTLLVDVNKKEALERLINMFRIDLSKWDRSKTFEFPSCNCINYTIVCTEEVFVSIVNCMNGTRVY